MDLNDIRKDIDAIDLQIRDLLMQRLDCSRQVAEAKQAAGSTEIYRADREQAMLDALGAGVPDDRRAPYLAVVRKITETSRMYQYNLLYDGDPDLFATVEGSELALQKQASPDAAEHALQKLASPDAAEHAQVTVRLSRPDRPNALSAILTMIGDHGFDLDALELVEGADSPAVTFDLTIRGDVANDRMRRLLFQLSKESSNFRILAVS